jgi:hypothetical protein
MGRDIESSLGSSFSASKSSQRKHFKPELTSKTRFFASFPDSALLEQSFD